MRKLFADAALKVKQRKKEEIKVLEEIGQQNQGPDLF